MKIGILNVRPDYNDSNVPIFLPNGSDYLASFIKNKRPDWEAFVDYHPENILRQKPDVIGISSFTRTYTKAIYISRQLKKYTNVPILIGGHHITALPDKLDHSMDIGVIGEGENTLLELLELFERGDKSKESLSNIRGIVFRDDNGNLVQTPSRELIKDLDILPLPFRTRVNGVTGYWQESIFTSRGCPFRCKYCAISEFWDKIRYHSTERVIIELHQLLSKGKIDSITIHDDLFGINKKRLKELVSAIREEKLHLKTQFTCNARSSVFDEEIAQLFVDMNIKAIVFGMESANDRILSYMKGASSKKHNQKALEICDKYNLIAVPNFIIGFPSETKEEAAESYWFIRKNKPIIGDFRIFPACPLPGTYLWDYSINKEIIPKDFSDWEALDLEYIPERSVYLNDAYNKEEYQQILGEFLDLNEKKKSFDLVTQDKSYKNKYNFLLKEKVSLLINNYNIQNLLEISGLEINIGNYLRNKFQNISIIPENGYINLDKIPSNSIDIILLTNSLEKLKNPQNILSQLKEKLTENGKIILITYNVKNPLFTLNILCNKDIYSSWGIHELGNISHFSLESLNNIIQKSGLIIEKQSELNIDFINKDTQNIYKNIIQYFNNKTFDINFEKVSDILILKK